MLIAAFIALVIGVFQVFLTALTISAAVGAKAVKALLSVGIKLIVYGVAFFVLFKLFKAFVIAAAIGYGIGFFVCLFAYFIYKIIKG